MATPKLTEEFMKEKIELINSPEMKNLRIEDFKRFQVYNGNLKKIVEDAIRKEFKQPKQIEGLLERVVPINIMRRIINKLAGLYIEAPVRNPRSKDESDQELVEIYEDSMSLNQRMKEANRYFKMWKRNVARPFVADGKPMLRNIPKFQYEVFSDNMLQPEIPDTYVEILREDKDVEKSLYAFFTADENKIVNGKAQLQTGMMKQMNNPDGKNELGILPIVYINESSVSVNPLPDDDLLRMSILIPLLLTDLAFASKYLTWSIIWIAGYDGDIPAGPASILTLPLDERGNHPKIGTVKPEFAMQDQLAYVENLVTMLLTTKNLSTSSVKSNMNALAPSSGIAKALDEAQSVEDKKDQQDYFLKAEGELWKQLHENYIPFWRKRNLLSKDFNKEFNNDFEINVTLQEPKVTLTEEEQIKITKAKIGDDAKLSTLERELRSLNPDMDTDQVKELEVEILEDQAKKTVIQSEMVNEMLNEDKDGQQS